MDQTQQMQMVNGAQHVRVSILDDALVVRAALRDPTESAEHFVMEFASAEEFLASECTREADCLILDVLLPGLNGLDLQDQPAELGCRDCQFVFVTAHSSGETRPSNRARRHWREVLTHTLGNPSATQSCYGQSVRCYNLTIRSVLTSSSIESQASVRGFFSQITTTSRRIVCPL